MGEELRAKLFGQTGETLTESLVSLLISSLSILMLATAISAAFGMINASRTKLSTYYQKNNDVVAEASSGSSGATATSGNVQIKEIKDDGTGTQMANLLVTYVTNSDGGATSVVSYKKVTT